MFKFCEAENIYLTSDIIFLFVPEVILIGGDTTLNKESMKSEAIMNYAVMKANYFTSGRMLTDNGPTFFMHFCQGCQS
ncbi:hypothetical protein D6T17_24870 [Salmonella enterica subsp. enterica serovar Oranienburg]|uniref:Uncharacterized protein n=4 Tax=Salmonella enterica I TaxID=59201 RepID=A0A5X8XZ66_SALNE|nr:hypothetical protein LFZ16_03345 [Salmonella enterica subsp. enterica serovar India str. SA20085604]EAA8386679.1 hypothetical protein [Salmonella enterica]EBR7996644.1 hypothetical protein [Salmonella enterica subsp. enterica serovar Panama]EBS4088651.1 hypothetical protein [Salmonella enterica subsp. enterica serovar Newport]EBV1274919.1 hypothetical protein [Salmonella enterica subsp. enterica serovar Oranienburg]EBW8395996.1 hypothetical protein [Salmonella enterica subsp. enterica serov